MLAAGDGGGHGLVQRPRWHPHSGRYRLATVGGGSMGLGNWGSGLVGAVCDTERVARPYS